MICSPFINNIFNKKKQEEYRLKPILPPITYKYFFLPLVHKIPDNPQNQLCG